MRSFHQWRYPQAFNPAGSYFVPLQGAITKINPGDNVQTAINNISAGNTLWFNPGTYTITTALTLKSGICYHGVGATLLNTTGLADMAKITNLSSVNITIDGLTFDGARLGLVGTTGTAGSADNITVANCTFQNITGPSTQLLNGAIFSVGLKNSSIINNKFTNIQQGFGATFLYEPNNVNVNYNYINNVYDGFRVTFQGVSGSGNNLHINYNTGDNIERMAICTQGLNDNTTMLVTDMQIIGNWFSGWISAALDSTANTIPISAVSTGTGTLIQNNYAKSGATLAGNIGIEVNGNNTICSGNYLDGFKTGIECYWPGITVSNNNIVGNQFGAVTIYTANGASSSNVTISGTTANAGLAVPARPVL